MADGRKKRSRAVIKIYRGRVSREEMVYRLIKLLFEAKMNGRV